ncbi:pentatricopeptide repeat-containing protein At2g01860 [Impatiens glandulifera]|uniref:pentatricopeptide repeat-containing protein At2g01860 n=1 Tax=Impatiens glandulifera TaxID=253017 RepID=UPI001FB085DA|nr:pentatricopeptide repeat-containing protein At2g01860 [Impatiens glandulifera]
MDSLLLLSSYPHSTLNNRQILCCGFKRNSSIILMVSKPKRKDNNKLPRNRLYRRRTELPPDTYVNTVWKKTMNKSELSDSIDNYDDDDQQGEKNDEEEEDILWGEDEIEAISSLFKGRISQKPGQLKNRERALPLPIPYKIRPLSLPTPKTNPLRKPLFNDSLYKNPTFLIDLANKIRSLNPDEDVSKVLNKSAHLLRKGSLSLTIRELGHLGLPKRSLETLCWAQKQPRLFPDDRILASTVEVLARSHELKLPFNLRKFTSLASRNVIEAMVKGFIKGGTLGLAWKLLQIAKDSNRMLDSSIYAKLILQLGKNPDKELMVVTLLEELGERDDLNLNQQDCTSIMKVCIRLGKFELVESLFNWFVQTGHEPGIVVYTTLIYSRYTERRYREALEIVWEMESLNILFDLPAYRVVIRVFVASNDLTRAVRYFAKLKEAGFSPTFDIYRDLFAIYMASGRMAKCKEIFEEAEMAGFQWDKNTKSQLLLHNS